MPMTHLRKTAKLFHSMSARVPPGASAPLKTTTNDDSNFAKTIVRFRSPYRLREMLPGDQGTQQKVIRKEQQFKIRIATSDVRRRAASMLVRRMYLSKGYGAPMLDESPYRITILVSQDERVVGTTTLGLDSSQGLLADQSYKDELDKLRSQGRRVCEMTKLAIDDENVDSKHIVAVLFHLCKIYGHNIHQVSDFVIEINPRHVLFYKRMLGFEEFGPEKTCPRVNAPSLLLRLPVEYADEQITRFGGQLSSAKAVKSLYPYCFSKDDEVGITGRLQRGD